ncbi:hypothetical protein ANO11243_032730 [Dothideomycetidae sp. 11243]|nr:hypothetical protein ANO11243_032730 [fungal sp. No.11243]
MAPPAARPWPQTSHTLEPAVSSQPLMHPDRARTIHSFPSSSDTRATSVSDARLDEIAKQLRGLTSKVDRLTSTIGALDIASDIL